ncbi:glycosyltransferase family 39 protein [Propioniciclava soli]|uniref:Glycosyltransferase family 39 protein n=1 Tax=Propioniciclava soli TaxID=2775081 RepID=A0ABZ3C9T9_9ACTN
MTWRTRTASRFRSAHEWQGAVLLALCAALWWAPGISVPSLWADEAATLSAVGRSWPDLVRLTGNIDAVHGVYYATVKVWLDVLPNSELTLRLPSLVASAATASTLYLLARTWLSRGSAALASVAFIALPRTTWMAIEGRSWALGTLVATLTTLLLVRWTDSRRPALLVFYAAMAGLGVSVNIYMAFLVVGHGVTLLMLRTPWRRVALWCFAAAAGGLIGAPVILRASGQRGQLGERASLTPLSWLVDVATKQFTLGDTPGDDWVPRLLWLGSALALGTLSWLVVAIGLWSARRRPSVGSTVAAWGLPWVLVPTIVVAALSMVGGNVYHPRYFSFGAPAFALLLAAGLVAIPRGRVVVALVLLTLTLPVMVSQRTPHAKAGYDYRDAAAAVEGSRAGDGVYFGDSPPARMASIAYPKGFRGVDDFLLRETPAQEASLDGTSEALSSGSVRGAPSRIWAMWSVRDPERDADESVFVDAGYRKWFQWDGPETDVVLWVR